MAMIQTARGPIESANLGRVLIHEHVFLMDMEYTYNYRPDFFEDATIQAAAAKLDALKAAGVDTIIDLTVLGLGRHAPSLAKVGALTDLNIVVSTGPPTALPGSTYGPGGAGDGKLVTGDSQVVGSNTPVVSGPLSGSTCGCTSWNVSVTGDAGSIEVAPPASPISTYSCP